MIFSLILGLFIGSIRALGTPLLKKLGGVYVEVFRNIPSIVQLFFWFFAMGLGQWNAVVIGLSIIGSARISETFRSGIQSIHKAQIESAESSGLSPWQTAIYVVIPQAIMIVLPPLGTDFLGIMKETSIAMVLGIRELTFQTQEIDARTFRGFEAATAVTVIYLLLSFIIVNGGHYLEGLLKVNIRVLR